MALRPLDEVSNLFLGTTPLAVIAALSGAGATWDRECYFQQHLLRHLGPGDDPQPFFACIRALDAAMIEGDFLEYRNFFDLDRRDRGADRTVPGLVMQAIGLVIAEAKRRGL